jgi:hypothetical protein
MGTIDQTTHRFTCTTCSVREETTIHERGSSYGASWGSPSELVNFEVDWKTDKFGEPRPVRALCRTCGGTPGHEVL